MSFDSDNVSDASTIGLRALCAPQPSQCYAQKARTPWPLVPTSPPVARAGQRPVSVGHRATGCREPYAGQCRDSLRQRPSAVYCSFNNFSGRYLSF